MKKDIEVIASEKIKELRTNDRFTPNYFPKEHLQVDEVVIYNNGGRNQFKKTLLETTEVLSTTNHKFLKIWEFYEPTESSTHQWEYGKRGIFIPIKDAKKWIKRLYEHYYNKQ